MNARLKRPRLWTAAALLTAGTVAAGFLGLTAPTLRGADDKTEAVAPIARTYIGELAGAPDSARIAVVVEGDKFVAYVCSADDKFNQAHSRWFRGDVKAGAMTAKVDGVELKAAVKGDGVSGTLTKDKAHAFTAAALAGDANAGLFRAADTVDGDEYVIGWIVDEKENVVGTGSKRGAPPQTLQAPKGNGNLNPQVGDKKLEPKKVAGAGPAANAGTNGNTGAAPATGKKVDDAARAEMLQDLIAARKADGGNAIQAMLIHQMRRVVAGKKPETKLEEKVFAVLKTAPANSLTDYLKDWDKIPKADRETILGKEAAGLDANKALDAEQAKKLAQAMPRLRAVKSAPTPRAAATGTVKGVTIPTVTCIDETNPEVIGKDEIFAIHTVIVGNGSPSSKKTGILTGFDDGVEKSFAGADASAFPLPGQANVDGAEVFIVTTLYEDDGEDLKKFFNFLKPLIQAGAIVAVEALNGDQKTLGEFDKALIKIGVDAALAGAAAGLGKLFLQALGTDSITARPDGSVVADNGGAKTKMTFKKVKNGDTKYSYELKGFAVQR